MAKKDDAFIVFTGLVIGAAAGAVAGILLAPASGKKTCERLRENSNRMRQMFREQFSGICLYCQNTDSESVKNTMNPDVKKSASKAQTSAPKRKLPKSKDI